MYFGNDLKRNLIISELQKKVDHATKLYEAAIEFRATNTYQCKCNMEDAQKRLATTLEQESE